MFENKHNNHDRKITTSDLLTHWGRVTHICVGKLIILGSDYGLSPGRTAPSHYLNQWWDIVNWTLGNKLQRNINRNSHIFEKMQLKMSSGKWRPSCLGLNVLSVSCVQYIWMGWDHRPWHWPNLPFRLTINYTCHKYIRVIRIIWPIIDIILNMYCNLIQWILAKSNMTQGHSICYIDPLHLSNSSALANGLLQSCTGPPINGNQLTDKIISTWINDHKRLHRSSL